jgi:hypothetical protein
MSTLPTEAFLAAEFLVHRLYRPIALAPNLRFCAIAETENQDDDNWFWTDDNAKVLEFLSRPEVWQRFPDETHEILCFVRSMCKGPFIFRRVSAPRLDLVEKQGTIISYRHSLLQIKYDKSSGNLTLGMRFHDERSADSLSLVGSYIEFSYRRRRFKIPLIGLNYAAHTEHDRSTLILKHSADLDFSPFWQRIPIGRITFSYTIDARSMLIDTEVALDLDPGIQVYDVVLTIGHALEHRNFEHLITNTEVVSVTNPTRNRNNRLFLHRVEASYYQIKQPQSSGDSIALHSVPREPARASEIETVMGPHGRLLSAVARYAFPGPHRGERLAAAESKLITAGGFYDRTADYGRFIREAAGTKPNQYAAYDYSISYDYGVVINAFAKCFASCALGGIAMSPMFDGEELRSLVDHNLDFYFELYVDRHQHQPNVIFSRELAFVVLAVATMYRATGSEAYLLRLRRLCDVLLEFEVRFDAIAHHPASGFLMRMDSPRVAYVDCQSAALLALTLAANYVSDPRLPAVIDRGLQSYCVETCRFDGGIVDTIAALMVDSDGVRRTENGFWNFKVGMTLRFFAALRNAVDPQLRAIADRHRERIDLLEMIMRRQLERSVSRYEDGIEIRCSPLSAETNSETQPWTMLGLIGHPYD